MSKAKVPTDAERKRLMAVTGSGRHSLRNLAIVQCSYKLGLRAKELSALLVGTVIGPRGELLDEVELTSVMTKGGQPRMAYLTHSGLRSSLKLYLDERRHAQGILFNSAAPLFLSQRGAGFTPNTMQQLLGALHEKAGIVGGRSHSGRRTFATTLINKGVDLRAVQVLMGHASISQTADYVAHDSIRLRRIVAELA